MSTTAFKSLFHQVLNGPGVIPVGMGNEEVLCLMNLLRCQVRYPVQPVGRGPCIHYKSVAVSLHVEQFLPSSPHPPAIKSCISTSPSGLLDGPFQFDFAGLYHGPGAGYFLQNRTFVLLRQIKGALRRGKAPLLCILLILLYNFYLPL